MATAIEPHGSRDIRPLCTDRRAKARCITPCSVRCTVTDLDSRGLWYTVREAETDGRMTCTRRPKITRLRVRCFY